MIVAGFSPIGPQMGVSSGIVAIGAWLHFALKSNVLVIQTDFTSCLEEPLLGAKRKKQVGFFEVKGMDEVIRLERSGFSIEGGMERAIMTLFSDGNQLDLLPSTTKQNESLYEEELIEWLPKIIEKYEQQYDYILIDVGWKQKALWETLQTVYHKGIIFLPQNRWILERMEEKNWNEKDRVVIAPYHSQSFLNYTNFKLCYPTIGQMLIGMIPFQTQYMDHWSKGNAMEYLSLQSEKKREGNYTFWEQIEKIGKKIERELQVVRKKSEVVSDRIFN